MCVRLYQIILILLLHPSASTQIASSLCNCFLTTIVSQIQQHSSQQQLPIVQPSTNLTSPSLNSQKQTGLPVPANNVNSNNAITSSTSLSVQSVTTVSAVSNGKESTSPPPSKKMKCEPKDMVDACVGTSVGTITEPDCLGPCEPGTSVTLEGIVWHETEGGVLVVNVTWRGKTYVGTLLDCTRHDWAPPR